jgi:hypothetical protein
MTTKTPDRVVELWPSLPEAARKTIVDIAERTSPRELPLDLTSEETRLLEQGQDDFKHGRTLTLDEFSADMDAFMAGLRENAGKV